VENILENWSGFDIEKRSVMLVFLVAAMTAALALPVFSQTQLSTSDDGLTMIVNDAPEMEVVALGKSVIVKGRAKGILAIGGDVTVEGRVDGDVATIGGSIVQKHDAYIGGDVIAFGGAYRSESQTPLREAGKETVMFGMFEDELRAMAQDPASILTPTFSLAFLAQRLLSVLFWFVVSMGLSTLAPGAVSRAIARFQLSTLKVFVIGTAAFVATLVGVIGSVNVLPDYLSVSLGLMAFALLMLAYVFGRVALQLSAGKFVQKHLFSSSGRSDTVAILLGTIFWTALLSIPYIWTFAVVALFLAGLGLVLTARPQAVWRQT
jgi:hypothetical protein